MTDLPSDFTSLLPRVSAAPEKGPVYYLWVFDPHEDKVILEHNEDRHPAQAVDHGDLAKRVTHEERVHGFAYRIHGGFRITDWEHKPLKDPHVLEAVRKALQHQKHSPAEGGQVQARAISAHI